MKRRVVLTGLALAIAFSAGWFLRGGDDPVTRPMELAKAFPLAGPLARDTCVPATAEEAARYELMVHVLDEFGEGINSLKSGAQVELAHGLYRGAFGEASRICAPEGLYRRAAEVMVRHGMWEKGRLVESGLKLASRIGKGRPEIVEAVAVSAFNEHAQESEYFSYRDIRPLARTVLAGFGRDVAAFGETAFPLISAEDAMGTGAAQVAAAAGNPDALPKISALMSELLASVPAEESIPWDKRNRLYELAYAIVFAGEAGQTHVEPILDLMRRKVRSWAPPFGMIKVDPKRMCAVLRQVSTDAPEQVGEFPYCVDEGPPYEQ